MKKALNSLIFCFIILAMLLNSAAVIAADGDEAIGVLTAAGILDEEFDAEAEMLKGDYIKYALNVLKFPVVPADKQIFFDVPLDNKYADYVNMAYSIGIIKGGEDGTAGVNRAITLDEAIVLAVRILNCGNLAEQTGGYASGYSQFAAKLGLYKNISGSGNNKINGRTAAQILFNAVTSEYLTTKNGDDFSFSEKSLLEADFKIYKISGILESCVYGGIYGEKAVNTDTVVIDGETYIFADKKIAKEYLGCKVTVYVKEDNGDNEIIYMYLNGNNINEISVENIISCKNSSLLYYTPKGRQEKLNLSSSVITLKNGQRIVVSNNETAIPDYGKFKVIDNDSDGKYDVIMISEYEIGIVSNTDAENKKIYTQKGPNKVISLDDYDKYAIYNAEGNLVDIDYITENMVLNIYKSGTDLIELEAYNDTVEFELSALTENGTDGRRFHQLSDSEGNTYETVVKFGDISDDNNIKPNNKYLFALNSDGKIASVISRVITDGYEYGYLYRCSFDASYEDAAVMRILTEAGTFSVFETEKKIKDCGAGRNMTPSELLGIWKQGLVRYRLNSEGKVSAVEFPDSDTEAEKGFHLSYDDDTDKTGWSSNRYDADYFMVGTHIPINKETRIFFIPAEGKEDNLDLYSASIGTKLADGSNYPGIKSYKYDNDDIYADVLLVPESMELSKISATMIIEKISDVYDANEDTTKHMLSGMMNGGKAEVYVADYIDLSYTTGKTTVPIEEGDVIRYSTNLNDEAAYIQMVYDCSEKQLYNQAGKPEKETKNWGDSIAHFGGTVDSVSENMYIKFKDSKEYYPVGATTRIYKCEDSRYGYRLSVINAADIPTEKDDPENGAFAVIVTRDATIPFIAVYVN